MRVLGYELSVRKAAPLTTAPLSPLSGRAGGWMPIVREPYTGAWQRNEEIRPESVLANPTVYACIKRIAEDIGKLRLRLVEQTSPGIWNETSNSAYSPVLRNPNHYQLTPKFVEYWITSKLETGNAYVLKSRDARGVVNRLYVLQPSFVTPLVAPDGSVWYQLKRDDLPGVKVEITVPAREIIHDRMICLFHPLIGIGPLFASALAAMHGIQIQKSSSKFFSNGSRPGGLLIAPGAITQEDADIIAERWNTKHGGDSTGGVAVVSHNLKYEPLSFNAVDSQLVEQMNKSQEDIAECFGVPLFFLNSTKGAPYANNEALVQLYYAQCLQSLITNFETSLDDGLEIAAGLGTEFDLDDLIWMDTATRTAAAASAVGAGVMTPNEARQKYFALGPVKGGDTPYMQQQNYSLEALAERDAAAPFAKPAPAPEPDENELPPIEMAAAARDVLRAVLELAPYD